MENSESSNICKIVILESSKRRLFHAKLHENFPERPMRHKKPSGTKRCLFGKADPEDTRRMLDEQYLVDQRRLLAKFGFDIETIEHLERGKDDTKENDRNGQNREARPANGKNSPRKILKARRKVCFSKAQANQSQKFITDFYQARKSGNGAPLLPPEKKCSTNQSAPFESC